MNVEIKNSFSKDIDKILNKKVLQDVESIILEFKKVNRLHELSLSNPFPAGEGTKSEKRVGWLL